MGEEGQTNVQCPTKKQEPEFRSQNEIQNTGRKRQYVVQRGQKIMGLGVAIPYSLFSLFTFHYFLFPLSTFFL